MYVCYKFAHYILSELEAVQEQLVINLLFQKYNFIKLLYDDKKLVSLISYLKATYVK